MTEATTAGPKTQTLEAKGATITYDIREAEKSADVPTLVLIGSPMDASGFTSLAGHFRDRRVVTYDPRGVGRSKRTDGKPTNTPEEHADDVSRVIAAVGGGTVDLFASSGGAVNALALVAKHPEQVRMLVAHEPPTCMVLPDREQALAAVADMGETYQTKGFGAAMAKFMALTSLTGPIPADFPERPADPSAFGLPAEDDGARGDPLFEQNLVSCTHYEPDFDALRRASTRIVLAGGEESEGTLAYRGAVGVAEGLDKKLVTFPSHHGGFMGGEFGWPGKPEEFAAKLRAVLSET